MNFRMSEYMVYESPGAGSVALACNHSVRYPDICELCSQAIHNNDQNLNQHQPNKG